MHFTDENISVTIDPNFFAMTQDSIRRNNGPTKEVKLGAENSRINEDD